MKINEEEPWRILNKIDVGLIGVDNKFNIFLWNNWMQSYSGMQSQELLTKNYKKMFKTPLNTRLKNAIEMAIIHELPAILSNVFNRSPLPLFDKNNHQIQQSISVNPIKYKNQNACIIQITDVSPAVAREHALELQVLERKKAEWEKNIFFTNMSHEIRTPLNGVLGMLELLRKSGLTEKQNEFANIAHESAHFLLYIISDILDFSKIEAGKLTLETSEFNLLQLVTDQIASMSPAANKKGVEINFIHQLEPATYIISDKNRLKQVLLNLLSNAVKFTEKGQIEVEMILQKITPKQHKLIGKVTDTGTGIEQQNQASLFKPFQQADSAISEKYGGTGLGLAITKQLCRLMDGDITLTSQFGAGSCFEFEVLVEPGEQPTENRSVKISKVDVVQPLKIDKPKVLVVEDNKINQIVVQECLKELGYGSDVVNNGKEALFHLKNNSYMYPLILMDCQMHEMNGFDATIQIRLGKAGENYKKVNIIALTANATSQEKEHCLKAGMDDFLSKPIQLNKLNDMLAKYL